jgi:hypothetical protein
VFVMPLLFVFSEAREPYQPPRHFEVIAGRREAA